MALVELTEEQCAIIVSILIAESRTCLKFADLYKEKGDVFKFESDQFEKKAHKINNIITTFMLQPGVEEILKGEKND